MRLLPLLCLAALATRGFGKEQEEEIIPKTFISYKVLEVFPKGRRVLIVCHSPQMPPPITYSLLGSRNVEVTKTVVGTRDPASFTVNITLKSRPDLLTYSCQAAPTSGATAVSTPLQMYWELWAKPVSQLHAHFTLIDRGAGPRMEMSCWAASGSPPITYSLVGNRGHVHMHQTVHHRQPVNFSFPLTQTSDWVRCQAGNDISVQSSTSKLVPPGELPWRPILVLAGSLTSIAAITCGMLAWSMKHRL
ncbi:protein IL-40 isoform X2 [Choloepus didactylus]|uniref:protein IL-40 isoform X2 n=1 Tax=Choloepus didactylus TaxID=27675 RepID=UPI00189D2398|nr:protein IL-40 isoform X2 [Choloepus didactylus]